MDDNQKALLSPPWEKRVSVAITGASGAPYALALLKQLVAANVQVFIMMSSSCPTCFSRFISQ